jgi:2-polyprenyl-3-methyl-5-hydroxy-6-metoxy-1,4-benzoquinol methylase
LLKRFSEAGYDVRGCDVDDRCVALSSRFAPVQKLTVEEVTLERFDAEFDCVVLSHVLEHLENPRQALLRLSALTSGVMVVSFTMRRGWSGLC